MAEKIKQAKATQEYNDQSIKSLKGEDRVRKRPGVIFGSDGLEGCEHSFFEILSNSVDEARDGHGNEIKVTTVAVSRSVGTSRKADTTGISFTVSFTPEENTKTTREIRLTNILSDLTGSVPAPHSTARNICASNPTTGHIAARSNSERADPLPESLRNASCQGTNAARVPSFAGSPILRSLPT